MRVDSPSKPIRFKDPAALAEWFEKNHARVGELWIHFYKLHAGKASVTYPEALDEALCVGWIDGVRKRVDEESYIMRFTPRKRGSYWSTVNIRNVERLLAAGRMRPAGLKAFEGRDASAERRYSFEQRPHDLPADAVSELKKDARAWGYWREQPTGYRRAVAWWIVSSKKPGTRAKRIALLLEHSRDGERVPPLVSPARRKR